MPPDQSDGELLERFIQAKDEFAFAELVRRHGLMVLGVCQRVLDNRHDAEDCFQAAFMVLARKADTIQPRDMVGNWLYGVAYRTALERAKLAARRRNLEKKKHAMPKPDSTAELWQDLRPVLDQELSRLPEKYRVVLVACDLEGKTRSEVAEMLDVPEGTVASRLARARALLAKRLHKHRMFVTPTLLASVLAEHAAPEFLPEKLLAQTMRLASGSVEAPTRVVRLSDAVVGAMLWTRLKVATAVLCVIGLLGVGVSSFVPSAGAERKPEAVKVNKGKPRRVSDCVIRKVDVENREVHAENGAEQIHVIPVDPGAAILVGEEAAGLAGLRPGMIVDVLLERNADGRELATRIAAVGQAISGTIQVIEKEKITLHAEGQPALPETTFDLDPEIEVKIDGKGKKPADLKEKMKITLWLLGAKKKVVAIEAAGPKVEGVVQAIDVKKRTLEFERAGVAEAVAVADDAVVILDSKATHLTDVKTGMRVTLQMSASPTSSQVVAIRSRP